MNKLIYGINSIKHYLNFAPEKIINIFILKNIKNKKLILLKKKLLN